MANPATERYCWRMLCQAVPPIEQDDGSSSAALKDRYGTTKEWANENLGAMKLNIEPWELFGEDAWDLFVRYGKALTLEDGEDENAPLRGTHCMQMLCPITEADTSYVHPASSVKCTSDTYVRQVVLSTNNCLRLFLTLYITFFKLHSRSTPPPWNLNK